MPETLEKLLTVACLFPFAALLALMVHELGHYAAARMLNVRVDHVSIGYGRAVRSWTGRRHVRWILRFFPLGGYVHLAGRGDLGGEGDLFEEKSPAGRMAVILAGPAVNLVLPLFLLFPFFLLIGQPSTQPVIAGIEKGEVADQAGFEIGDRFLEIEGRPVRRYEEVLDYTRPVEVRPLDMILGRNGRTISVTVTPEPLYYVSRRGLEKETGRLGILVRHQPFDFKAAERIDGIDVKNDPDKARALLRERLGRPVLIGFKSEDRTVRDYRVIPGRAANEGLFDPDHEHYDHFYAGRLRDNFYLELTLSEALRETVKETGRMIYGIATIPLQLIPLDTEHIGPEAHVSKETSPAGFFLFRFLYMTGMVSVVLALINLVPFPGLDGHRLMFSLSEALIGRERTQANRLRLTLYVLGGLYALLLIVNLQDVATYSEVKIEQASEWMDRTLKKERP